MSESRTLTQAVDTYLEERRRLGFSLQSKLLQRFALYADEKKHTGPLTAELQLNWAQSPGVRTSALTARRRIEGLRPFVRHYCQYEPESIVVDPSLVGPRRVRPTPHIYTSDELSDLVTAAQALEGSGGLRGAAYATLFGLIAATGLRLSEALQLRDVDVDVDARNLVVRLTKFRKSRRLPLQESTSERLLAWRAQRDRRWRRNPNNSFLVGSSGTVMKGSTVQTVFEGLRNSLDWKSRGSLSNPRIQDLRHTFAVQRVQLWHEEDAPLEQAMFWLCTYLGHAKISDTYWYLTGVPELMAIAGQRFEQFVVEPVTVGGA